MRNRMFKYLIALFSTSIILLLVIFKYIDVPSNKKIIIDNSKAAGNSAETSIRESKMETTLNIQESKTETTISSNRFSLVSYTFLNKSGVRVIKDPNDMLVLVNKSRNLPSDWVPKDLAVPKVSFAFKEDSPRKYMQRTAALALEDLFNQAKKANIMLVAASGYRPFDTQKRIFNENVRLYGEKAANQISAYPGQSEHQTGLSMDVTSRKMNFQLEESFGDTAEGKWLKENAARFGFVIRYQKGKENITKYSYEPWHIRYVGKETAASIASKGITMEEYFNAFD